MNNTIKALLIMGVMVFCSHNLHSQYSHPGVTTWQAIEEAGFIVVKNKPDPTQFDSDFTMNANVTSNINIGGANVEVHKVLGIPVYGLVSVNGNVTDSVSYFGSSVSRAFGSGIGLPNIYNDSLTFAPSYPVNVKITNVLTGVTVLEELAELPSSSFVTYVLNDTSVFGLFPGGVLNSLVGEPYKIIYTNLPVGVYFISFFNPAGEMIYIKTLYRS